MAEASILVNCAATSTRSSARCRQLERLSPGLCSEKYNEVRNNIGREKRYVELDYVSLDKIVNKRKKVTEEHEEWEEERLFCIGRNFTSGEMVMGRQVKRSTVVSDAMIVLSIVARVLDDHCLRVILAGINSYVRRSIISVTSIDAQSLLEAQKSYTKIGLGVVIGMRLRDTVMNQLVPSMNSMFDHVKEVILAFNCYKNVPRVRQLDASGFDGLEHVSDSLRSVINYKANEHTVMAAMGSYKCVIIPAGKLDNRHHWDKLVSIKIEQWRDSVYGRVLLITMSLIEGVEYKDSGLPIRKLKQTHDRIHVSRNHDVKVLIVDVSSFVKNQADCFDRPWSVFDLGILSNVQERKEPILTILSDGYLDEKILPEKELDVGDSLLGMGKFITTVRYTFDPLLDMKERGSMFNRNGDDDIRETNHWSHSPVSTRHSVAGFATGFSKYAGYSITMPMSRLVEGKMEHGHLSFSLTKGSAFGHYQCSNDKVFRVMFSGRRKSNRRR